MSILQVTGALALSMVSVMAIAEAEVAAPIELNYSWVNELATTYTSHDGEVDIDYIGALSTDYAGVGLTIAPTINLDKMVYVSTDITASYALSSSLVVDMSTEHVQATEKFGPWVTQLTWTQDNNSAYVKHTSTTVGTDMAGVEIGTSVKF